MTNEYLWSLKMEDCAKTLWKDLCGCECLEAWLGYTTALLFSIIMWTFGSNTSSSCDFISKHFLCHSSGHVSSPSAALGFDPVVFWFLLVVYCAGCCGSSCGATLAALCVFLSKWMSEECKRGWQTREIHRDPTRHPTTQQVKFFIIQFIKTIKKSPHFINK